jgi:hypothetical protein
MMNKLYATFKHKNAFNEAFKNEFETAVYDIILDEKYHILILKKQLNL